MAGLLQKDTLVSRGLKEQWVEHLGYVSLFPLLLRLLPPDAPQLPAVLDLLADPDRLWTPYGLRSLSKADVWHGRQNAPGDEPYWRGPIWININYLALSGLRHYADADGPSRERAGQLYAELRANVLGAVQAEWERSGYLWEQHAPKNRTRAPPSPREHLPSRREHHPASQVLARDGPRHAQPPLQRLVGARPPHPRRDVLSASRTRHLPRALTRALHARRGLRRRHRPSLQPSPAEESRRLRIADIRRVSTGNTGPYSTSV